MSRCGTWHWVKLPIKVSLFRRVTRGISAMQLDLTQHGLQRFVDAQNQVYDSVCNELALGQKTSHWMWFVFPQLKGLGVSAIAKHFGLESKAEALAYWQHPILGTRLLECTTLVLAQPNTSALDIFGTTDALKFRSCMKIGRAHV